MDTYTKICTSRYTIYYSKGNYTVTEVWEDDMEKGKLASDEPKNIGTFRCFIADKGYREVKELKTFHRTARICTTGRVIWQEHL